MGFIFFLIFFFSTPLPCSFWFFSFFVDFRVSFFFSSIYLRFEGFLLLPQECLGFYLTQRGGVKVKKGEVSSSGKEGGSERREDTTLSNNEGKRSH